MKNHEIATHTLYHQPNPGAWPAPPPGQAAFLGGSLTGSLGGAGKTASQPQRPQPAACLPCTDDRCTSSAVHNAGSLLPCAPHLQTCSRLWA